jgi:hypothetical protein
MFRASPEATDGSNEKNNAAKHPFKSSLRVNEPTIGLQPKS